MPWHTFRCHGNTKPVSYANIFLLFSQVYLQTNRSPSKRVTFVFMHFSRVDKVITSQQHWCVLYSAADLVICKPLESPDMQLLLCFLLTFGIVMTFSIDTIIYLFFFTSAFLTLTSHWTIEKNIYSTTVLEFGVLVLHKHAEVYFVLFVQCIWQLVTYRLWFQLQSI